MWHIVTRIWQENGVLIMAVLGFFAFAMIMDWILQEAKRQAYNRGFHHGYQHAVSLFDPDDDPLYDDPED